MGDVVAGAWQERYAEQLTPWSPADEWAKSRAPQIDWIVEDSFIKGTVGILAGDGGLGKSLLLQQLITAAALGEPWLGMRTKQVRSLAVFCEDDVDELHRRQERINDHYNCRMGDLEGVLIDSRAGRDSVLMNFRQWGGDGRETRMFEEVKARAFEHGAQIVVLDTVADVFSGNEIDRNQPRTFIRALRRMALAIQGVVILTQHPSKEGISSGSGTSGSTGWNNSARSRLYLTRPKDKDNEETDERLLRTMKQNYGKFGGKTSITWRSGVFHLTEQRPERPEQKPFRTDPDWQE